MGREGKEGIFVCGPVLRRWRKVLDGGTVVISYDVGGDVVQVYNPETAPYAIGEYVELPVTVRVYVTKNGPRYSLVIPGRIEGEF